MAICRDMQICTDRIAPPMDEEEMMDDLAPRAPEQRNDDPQPCRGHDSAESPSPPGPVSHSLTRRGRGGSLLACCPINDSKDTAQGVSMRVSLFIQVLSSAIALALHTCSSLPATPMALAANCKITMTSADADVASLHCLIDGRLGTSDVGIASGRLDRLSKGEAMRLKGGSDAAFAAAAMNPEMAKTMLSSGLISQSRKIGFGLIAAGMLLSFLGFMLFLNKTLIGTGNLFIVAGVVLVVGWQKSKAFMFQRQRARGTSIFLFGVFLVLRGWARVGVLVELFGILNLFGNFLPWIASLIKKLPVVGPIIAPILESPAVEKAMAAVAKMGPKPSDDSAPPPGGYQGPPGAGSSATGGQGQGAGGAASRAAGYDWGSVLKKGASIFGSSADASATPSYTSPPPASSAPPLRGNSQQPPQSRGYAPSEGYAAPSYTDWASRPPPTAAGRGVGGQQRQAAWSAASQKEELERISREMDQKEGGKGYYRPPEQ